MIIAEIGMNHLGDFSLADFYVKKLVNSKIDGVTLQIREKPYYTEEKKSRLFSEDEYRKLVTQTKLANKKIGFAIGDESKIPFLESIGVDFYKVINSDINNQKLIDCLKKTGKEIILSTGSSSEKEISKFLHKNKEINNLTLNHTQLSNEVKDCNLLAIESLRSKFNRKVSFGSHCENELVIFMSLCYKPEHILFYIKKDSKTNYPDNKHALTISRLNKLTSNLKVLQEAIGNGKKIKMNNKIKKQIK